MRDLKASEHDPLDSIIEEFTARVRGGEHPTVKEYVDRYPESAERIRELFPALAEIEHVGFTLGHVEESKKTVTRIGEYSILREIGRGGMGVVYEAVQESLGRHVAIKVLTASVNRNPQYLDRFRREARAAGKLHHTNIIPVFGTGEADGIPYFTMQYIPGSDLDQVLKCVVRMRCRTTGLTKSDIANGVGVSTATNTTANGSSSGELLGAEPEKQYFERIAKLGVQAADGLAYAHSQGVLHRDVKPSNLLLDANGVLWIADFGLAKSEDGDNFTASGDLVGTVRYMAPERFQGTADPRSDIYSLGATLYELFTLQPAFGSPDRAQLIHQVLSSDPIRPRQLNPHIPRDLETIVLTALAKDPERRYQSSHDLAADLRRFLEDEPILARRLSYTELSLRWCRRNRPQVIAAGIVVCTLSVGITGTTFGLLEAQRHERNARAETIAKENALQAEAAQRSIAVQKQTEAEMSARAEVAQRRTAEADFQEARRVLAGYRELGEVLAKHPENERLAREILTRLVQVYDGFLSRHANDPVAWDEVLQARFRTASMHWTLGNIDKASALFEQGIASIRANPERVRLDATGQRNLASGLTQLACLKMNHGNSADAGTLFRESIALLRDLHGREPTVVATQVALGNALVNYGCILRGEGRYAESETQIREAIALEKQAIRAAPREEQYCLELVLALEGLGLSIETPERQIEAEGYWLEAIGLLRGLSKARPDSNEYPHLIGRILRVLATSQTRRGDGTRAEISIAESLGISELLSKKYPQISFYRWEHLNTLFFYCNMLEAKDRSGESEKKLCTALDPVLRRWKTQSTEAVTDGVLQSDVARLYFALGSVISRDVHRDNEAADFYRQSHDLTPFQPATMNNLAVLLLRSRNPQGWDRSMTVCLAHRAVELEPNEPLYWGTLSGALAMNGSIPEALAAAAVQLRLVLRQKSKSGQSQSRPE